MGMSYAEYWDGDPHLAVAYRKAYKLKRQYDNQMEWLQGLYFYNAISVCLENAFKNKGSSRANYIEKPIDIFPLTEQEKKLREQEEMLKMQKAMEQMIRKQQRDKSKG